MSDSQDKPPKSWRRRRQTKPTPAYPHLSRELAEQYRDEEADAPLHDPQIMELFERYRTLWERFTPASGEPMPLNTFAERAQRLCDNKQCGLDELQITIIANQPQLKAPSQ